MNKVIVLARILLGALFVLFGSNFFLHFLKMPMPTGDAGTYMGVLFMHHFLYVVGALQLIGGLLLLVGRFVPLGLVLLGPVIVNIILYHALLEPTGYRAGRCGDRAGAVPALRLPQVLPRPLRRCS